MVLVWNHFSEDGQGQKISLITISSRLALIKDRLHLKKTNQKVIYDFNTHTKQAIIVHTKPGMQDIYNKIQQVL
jgi:hypothetical protein